MDIVTVVMSTYNGEKHIIKQLESIFCQQDVNVRVVIRDDNSKDNTLKTISNYSKENPQNFITVISGENLGFAKSFWYALKLCPHSDYYAFADQDDIWKPDKLSKCINAMVQDPIIPQLSYCKMQRSDNKLNRLHEQIEIMKPEQLSKKLTLIKTFNYGAATVINNAAKELVCRCWPDADDVPHDMWVGVLCYWFGKVYYIDEELYYWIRYDTSVTGAGTKGSGIRYRIKRSLMGKSYPNISKDLLNNYSDMITEEDKIFLECIKNYKWDLKSKWKLLLDKDFKRPTINGTVVLKLGILMNWY